MFVCSVNDFLEKLSPFSPHDRWIDNAYDRLKEQKLLGTPMDTNSLVEAPQRSPKFSAKVEVDTVRVVHEPDAGNVTTVKWKTYRDTTPEHMEKCAFNPLEKIIEALHDCADPDNERKLNKYHHKNHPNQEMSSEISGVNLKRDNVITNPDMYEEGDKDIPLASVQTAVVMGFKKDATAEKISENRRQLVSAANHVMNDDPRRNWMYGITIENTNMSLWYFSRSYTMKSASFDFTKDFRTLIRVFLSFLYAEEQELGHDPSIFRRYYDNRWCYVYKLETTEGSKYYRTIEPLYNPCSHRITGRKSRVWKVIEVASPEDLAPIPGEHEVALKDCWVDQGSLSEKEIQKEIFGRLKDVQEAAYAWAPLGLREKLKTGLACPETYFMKVVWDWKEEANKEKPKYDPNSNLPAGPLEGDAADMGKAICSSQTPPVTPYPSTYTLSTPPATGQIPSMPRDYKTKQHYRVVYADVGESLAQATSLSDAVRAFEDIFIALTLLFLARWVHRDVSEGNIIIVRSEHGVRAKLSDLEYARSFNLEGGVASTDPKTGTSYFMPIEIHRGKLLFRKRGSYKADASLMTSNWNPKPRQPKFTSPSLRYNFAHDLESLWWIIVWIVLIRVKGARWLYKMIFTVLDFPHPDREDLFMMEDLLQHHLECLMNDTLCERKTHIFLTVYNLSLFDFYATGERQEATSYQSIYGDIWNVMEHFVRNMSGVSMELEDPSQRALPRTVTLSGSQRLGKRTRSTDNAATDSKKMIAEDDSSRKKQKSGGDVFEDTDEEDTAEEVTVQDMAGIAREDSNPRITNSIRGTWD